MENSSNSPNSWLSESTLDKTAGDIDRARHLMPAVFAACRGARYLSHRGLSEASGLNRGTIAAAEGMTKKTSFQTIRRLVEFFASSGVIIRVLDGESFLVHVMRPELAPGDVDGADNPEVFLALEADQSAETPFDLAGRLRKAQKSGAPYQYQGDLFRACRGALDISGIEVSVNTCMSTTTLTGVEAGRMAHKRTMIALLSYYSSLGVGVRLDSRDRYTLIVSVDAEEESRQLGLPL